MIEVFCALLPPGEDYLYYFVRDIFYIDKLIQNNIIKYVVKFYAITFLRYNVKLKIYI